MAALDDAYDDEFDNGSLVDPTEPMGTQSKHMLMLATEHFPEMVDYRYPLDMTSPASVDNVRSELGPAAQLPDDPQGLYYFVYVTDRSKNRVPVLIPEGEVRSFVFALALREDAIWARRLAYQPSLLP